MIVQNLKADIPQIFRRELSQQRYGSSLPMVDGEKTEWERKRTGSVEFSEVYD